ncbi:hypothetical protein [Sphingobacterium chuzhouense]|uniref:Uncharacterized protein n=1 Tax=Sphingobacterium chuzhouense TaxID=1742264 RepID=A0ABR7XPW4_9SPHI|nr:hypothetical protein [Sphingobacterium chuzhouense]MBD1421206.1 hypothetical protein [Sphingobacterium chuzhouense]
MRTLTKIFFITMVFATIASCDKPDEVPPKSQAFIREYVMPEPSLLTNEEREIVNKEREEYNKL